MSDGPAQLQQVLDGGLVDGTGAEALVVLAPADGAVLATGRAAGARDVDAALRAAHRAQEKTWGRAPGVLRTRHLLELARCLDANAAGLGALEARDTGTPLRQVLARDLPAGHAALQHHAGWADKLAHLGPNPDPRALGVSVHLMTPVASTADVLHEVAPALAVGCTVVVLAPATSPLGTLELGRLALEAGLPAGVLTVLVGPVRPELLGHREVDVVTVTGDPAAVAGVRRALVGTATPVRSRVHGEQVVVALEPPDTAAAVALALDGVRAHGRRLGGGLRLVVPETAVAAVRAQVLTGLAQLVDGDPLDPATDVGPPARGGPVTPGLLDDAFGAPGPVLSVHGHGSEEEAVRLVGGDPSTALRLCGADPDRLRVMAARLRGRVADDGPTDPRRYLRD